MTRKFTLLVLAIFCISLTACGKNHKKNVVSKGQATESVTDVTTATTSPSNTPQSESECTTLPTTQSVTTSRTDPPQVTHVSPTTAKRPVTTTTAPKVTQRPRTTTTAPTKQLIVPNASQCAVIENEIMRLVNQYRVSLGIAPYGIESKLIQGARIRAKETSHIDCFGHERPDGTSFSTIFAQIGYNGGGAGAENLTAFSNSVIGQNYFTCTNAELKAVAREMFNGWKASPGHNRNMINATLTKMGMGVYSYLETMTNGEKEVAFYGIQLFTLT